VLRIPPETAKYTRYLDLGSVPEGERPDLIQVLSGHVNGLSREARIVPPHLVPGTRGALLRLDLRDYGWDLEVFGSLAEASPYHHIRVEKYSGKDAWRNSVLAPWLSEGPGAAEAVKLLAERTRSRAPIVSGRWFLWQTATSEGKTPGYYDFLKVKDLKTFQQLIRFDRATAKELEHYRVLAFSGVTQEPRRLIADATVLGTYWHTQDNAAAVGNQNPLNVLDEALKFDVSEQFAPLPNGLPAWLLVDGGGKRQDKAPDSIVGAERRTRKDLRLQVGLDCIYCHLSGKRSGIIDAGAEPIRKLSAVDYDKFRELQRRYTRGVALERRIAADRAGYAAAVLEATGLTPGAYSDAYIREFGAFDEARVDAAWAGRDLGLTGPELARALRDYDTATGQLLSSLSGLAAGRSIPRRQWEEALPQAWLAIKGVKR